MTASRNINIRNTPEIFRERCMAIRPNLIFDKTNYVNSKTKVIVTCQIHGDFLTYPYNILKGHDCNSCACIKVHKNNRINGLIEKCNIVHNYFYDYSKVDLSLTQERHQIIICPTHGEFKQTLQTHKGGHKCSLCANEQQYRIGFSLSQWKDYQNNRIARVYFVRMFNETESFYKVGITYQQIKRRLRRIPYQVELINVKEYIDATFAFKLEKRFKKIFKKYKYSPLNEFGGHTECYANVNR